MKKVFAVLLSLSLLLSSFSVLATDETEKELDILNSNDDSALEPMIDALISANAKAVEDYKTTPDKIITFFAGQLMKQTKGKANVMKAKEIIKQKLDNM